MSLTCAFSGHRPEKLPWGSDETDPGCLALKIMLERRLRQLLQEGCTRFLCGMARGTDMYFLETLDGLRGEFPFTIEAVMPFARQSARWRREDRERWLRALTRCDRTVILEDGYSQGVMLRRNRYMVDHADVLLTVFDGTPGGTASTVRYARARGLRIESIWL